MRRALKQREEAKMQIVSQFESHDKIAKNRGEKLQKLKELYLQQKQDMEETQAEWQRQREFGAESFLVMLPLMCILS